MSRSLPPGLVWNENCMGTPGKALLPCEKDNVYWMRRAITASKDLEAGHRLILQDILWTRPMNGLRPGEEDKLLGGVLRVSVKRGEPLTADKIARES